MNVMLIKHAQTEAQVLPGQVVHHQNGTDSIAGDAPWHLHSDSALTCGGFEKACALGLQLSTLDWNQATVMISPERRVKQTLSAICVGAELNPLELNILSEPRLGKGSFGLSVDHLSTSLEHVYRASSQAVVEQLGSTELLVVVAHDVVIKAMFGFLRNGVVTRDAFSVTVEGAVPLLLTGDQPGNFELSELAE
jgi:broad specificity phosphatase PhoE